MGSNPIGNISAVMVINSNIVGFQPKDGDANSSNRTIYINITQEIDMKLTDTPALAFKWFLLTIAALGIIFAYTSLTFEWPVEKDAGIGLGAIMCSIGGGIGIAFHLRQREMMKRVKMFPNCQSLQDTGFHDMQKNYKDLKILNNGHAVPRKCTCGYTDFMLYQDMYYPTDVKDITGL